MELKNKLEEYTTMEFLNLLEKIWRIDVSEEEHDNLIRHVASITEYPAGTDLFFYPEAGSEHSPEGILDFIKKWRAENGKPGFKE
ncbi:TPA: bacteriocin immunity protein [Yersinia enterocolitica]|uniref:bacteriocin immunity protein n=1 Tax=Yersinia enterocolitica TaxID=630 RepID=UPI00155B3E8A|nr:bacteriocin immunity protein [Yersinia enterocolitica]EKN3725090.1 bacteriocin immunity protein [Yersinia enterocolitica]EKN3738271.1 bacteriocin immunity protein [Yersinia enterocolitica]EKN3948190.1 bacteriocin immunity protein [Yersinia enterocolitica]EKN4810876.1 bacteriocin immunity protein [Yersinia enterocolitica]EKN5984379.1 bacteriocin immunity protein [Yersinia enterocolitica]